MAILSEAITIDLIEAIDVANTGEDIHLLYPKPILKNEVTRDADEVNKIANEYGEPSQLSETARNTNNYVAYHMAYMAEKELYLKEHLAMFETTVAILGVTEDETLQTQKDNASLTLIDDFVSRDVEVWVHDDKVDEELIEEHGAKKITLNEAYDADCIIVMTDTPEYRQLDPNKIEKVIITALPIFNQDEFDNVKYSCVGHYRLKEGEML
jgi:UDP-N-acetyl-D-mannosaminuronate dehydrogenase